MLQSQLKEKEKQVQDLNIQNGLLKEMVKSLKSMIRVKGNKRVDSGRLPYLKQNKMENMNISKDYPDIKDNAKNE